MVQLRDRSQGVQQLRAPHFNSTMVQLRALDRSIDPHRRCLFQFHNGTIKRSCRCGCYPGPPLFQFHNGTIKRQGEAIITDTTTLFQFHNGTIKSIMSFHNLNNKKNFNSTMVQLRENQESLHSHSQTYFNSTMVQLREKRKSGCVTIVGLFQFHNGTIKSL